MKNLSIPMRRTEMILGLIYIVLQVFILPVALVVINVFLPRPFSAAELNFATFALNFICITVIFRRYLIDSFKILTHQPGKILCICLIGFGLYWFSSILVNMLVIFLDPEFSNVNDDNIAILTDQNYLLMVIGTVILVPVVEETLYRGVVFGQLYQKNHVIAYIVSVFIFSALHVFGYIGLYSPFRLLLCFLQYIPAGIFLAWTYVKADTIWAPVFIHMTVNLIGMLAM